MSAFPVFSGTKVLFVGNMRLGSNSRSLAEGLSDCGADVRGVDTASFVSPRILSRQWLSNRSMCNVGPDRDSWLLARLSAVTSGWRPDVQICFKTVSFDQDALFATGARAFVHYSADDVSNPANVSDSYLEHEHRWDLIVTTKRHNVPEIEVRTGKAPLFLMSAFDPRLHFRAVKEEPERFLVGFIGASRPDRSSLPAQLADWTGERCLVAGPRWRRDYFTGKYQNVSIWGEVRGDRFASTAALCKVGLVLLNSENRDTHTCRTFEVPATGMLPLLPRTDEHQAIFDGGSTSAVFYDDLEEVPDLLRWMGNAPDTVASIRFNSWHHIWFGGNTYRDRGLEILSAAKSM